MMKHVGRDAASLNETLAIVFMALGLVLGWWGASLAVLGWIVAPVFGAAFMAALGHTVGFTGDHLSPWKPLWWTTVGVLAGGFLGSTILFGSLFADMLKVNICIGMIVAAGLTPALFVLGAVVARVMIFFKQSRLKGEGAAPGNPSRPSVVLSLPPGINQDQPPSGVKLTLVGAR
ncbi:MAG: hypothetical protein NTV81_00425 [Candidatus Komeilibacteria bacterium]|nr:hypothetical protein [Candidatus Komeilibacteria bacterium]